MQDRHPIAFESHKLNETEQRYTVQEKEMTAIIHCLCTYFQSQKKITPKQARWQNFPEFDYVLEYKLGRGNVEADTLSGKDAIKDDMQHDLKSMKLMELAAQGKTRRSWVEDGLLLTSGRRVYVPNFGSIKWRIIKKSHDTPWAVHLGQRRMRALIEAI
ncbi:hypothetical protein KY289_008475 [Solanum tuberosum]|nr:hypothetical protein KY289_008475 [Solanum tuberosum]